tara:strand:+ start:999 stop:1307 length:309 start_codon:yes stop_codon:yes gene_type:complete
MADEIKFTDEELKSLSELSQGYQNIQSAFGQLRVQKILLEQQKESLEEAEVKMEADYAENQQKERDLVKELNEKYGPGQLDPQSGVFTPVPQEEAAEEVEES